MVNSVLGKTHLVMNMVAMAPVTVGKAAEMTGLTPGTARRIIKELELERYLIRDLMGRYAIGPRWEEVSEARARDPLQHECDVIVDELKESTSCDVCLFLADGIHSVCIAASRPTRFGVRVGERLPPSTSSSTQVLLAWSATRRVAARDHEVADPQHCQRVRAQGWAVGSCEPGVVGVSAPVRDLGGEVVAAVTIMTASSWMTRERVRRVSAHVTAAGQELSAALHRAWQRL